MVVAVRAAYDVFQLCANHADVNQLHTCCGYTRCASKALKPYSCQDWQLRHTIIEWLRQCRRSLEMVLALCVEKSVFVILVRICLTHRTYCLPGACGLKPVPGAWGLKPVALLWPGDWRPAVGALGLGPGAQVHFDSIFALL